MTMMNSATIAIMSPAPGAKTQHKRQPADQAPLRVLVAIVNYQCSDWTIEALKSLALARQQEPQFYVSVVDNDSQDGSIFAISDAINKSDWGSWISLTAAPRNGGFAYGCNLAAATAIRAGQRPDYIFLLNPDTKVAPDAISELMRFMDNNPQVGISGSRILNTDGSLRPSAWRFHSLGGELDRAARTGVISRLLSRSTLQMETSEQPHPVGWVTGAALMVRREVIEEVGWMDEGYFLYYEETDWCLRALRAGWSTWTVPASRVTHCVGQSTKATGEQAAQQRVPRYMLESRRRFFQKNHGLGYRCLADIAWLSGSFIYRMRCLLQRKTWDVPPHLIRDFLAVALRPTKVTGEKSDYPRYFATGKTRHQPPPLAAGSHNNNPPELSFSALVWEDYCTYDRNPFEPGFWVMANHRFGNWRMGIHYRLMRAPLTALYRTWNLLFNWLWGIKLDYTVQVGRRVRIWHHGGMVLGARAIGNDVQIRQNTTFGVANRQQPTGKPVIGDGVDIGTGAVIVGDIQIGAHSVIGANSLINRSVPPYSVVVGVPGTIIRQRLVASAKENPS